MECLALLEAVGEQGGFASALLTLCENGAIGIGPVPAGACNHGREQ